MFGRPPYDALIEVDYAAEQTRSHSGTVKKRNDIMALSNTTYKRNTTTKRGIQKTTGLSKSSSRPHLISVSSVSANNGHSSQADCNECHLNTHCFNQSLNKENIEALKPITRHPKPSQKGESIYRQDDIFSSIFIVRSGAVKTYHIDKEGEEYITGFFLPGEVFGTDGMHKGQHSQSAEALDTTTVCQISISKIEGNFLFPPQLQQILLKALCSDIHDRQQPLLMLHHKHAEQRLATFLSDISARQNQRGLSATEFNLPMSRRDIAQYLGMTEETISRLFTRFQKRELLSACRRNIVILDAKALTNLSVTIH